MKITKRLALKIAALALMAGTAYTTVPQRASAAPPTCSYIYQMSYNACRYQGYSDAYCKVVATNAMRSCYGY